MSILIVTYSQDNHGVDLVSDQLRRRGADVIRLDTDLYPTDLRLTSRWGAARGELLLSVGNRVHDLTEVTAIWNRRYAVGSRLSTALGDLRDPCLEESRRTLLGTLASMGSYEVNAWIAMRRADSKELQHREALAVGLDLPETLFTNDPRAVRRFAQELGRPLVTKMQTSFALDRDGREQVVFTSDVTTEDLPHLEGLSQAPMLFQEKLPKALDLRVTIVGERVMGAALEAQKSASTTDWRRHGARTVGDWVPYTLPSTTEASILALMRRLDLRYGAADFVLTPDGRHVFLELNAAGEWFWLDRSPGLPIAEAIAEELLRGVKISPSTHRNPTGI